MMERSIYFVQYIFQQSLPLSVNLIHKDLLFSKTKIIIQLMPEGVMKNSKPDLTLFSKFNFWFGQEVFCARHTFQARLIDPLLYIQSYIFIAKNIKIKPLVIMIKDDN